ncbi:MAG: hypothetical protein H0T91_07355 [Propionibacteriaceae bacterium]|nr:hypothetical protein [Propionibacteriaceae bacterium]
MQVAHLAVIVVGVLTFLYPLTIGATPNLTCRGVRMQPGDRCAKADNSGVQTYEQRAATADSAKPVIVGVGLLIAGFGAVLLAADLSKNRTPDLS